MFWYRLAAHQRRSVAETMEAVDSDEFVHWLAYRDFETLDFDGYMQAATLCCLVANALSRKHHYKPEDFMPIQQYETRRRKAHDTYRMMQSIPWPKT